jgi:hypothetical protein
VSAASDGGAEGLPESLRDMLLARIHGLSAAGQDVVRAAAVGGRRVHHELLAGAADLDEGQLTQAIREAVREHVLVADGDSVTFRHPLLQEAAYGELVPGEGARLHAACAHALEDRPELAGGTRATVTAEIAHHWLHAGDRPRALGASVRAGLEAERAPRRPTTSRARSSCGTPFPTLASARASSAPTCWRAPPTRPRGAAPPSRRSSWCPRRSSSSTRAATR